MADDSLDETGPLPRISALVAAAQRRWGSRALRRGAGAGPPPAPLPTGLGALDGLVGGGLPRGALTELLGAPTSGAATVALLALARAQREGALGAYLDLGSTFDAAYAAECGVDLGALLVARPLDSADALDLLLSLARSPEVGLVVADALAWLQATPADAGLLARALPPLAQALAASGCAAVAVTPLPYPAAVVARLGFRGSALAQQAALRVHLDRGPWEVDGVGGAAGPQHLARATVLKLRGGPDGRAAELAIRFAAAGGRP